MIVARSIIITAIHACTCTACMYGQVGGLGGRQVSRLNTKRNSTLAGVADEETSRVLRTLVHVWISYTSTTVHMPTRPARPSVTYPP